VLEKTAPRTAPLLSRATTDSRTLIHVAWETGEEASYFHGFVAGYAKATFSASTADRVVLASHELVENALRYSLISQSISYDLAVSSSEVRISVENGTTLARADMLRTQLQRIQSDPENTYTTELARSLTGTGRRSMLGLARICHEAHMAVSVSVIGSTLTVVATCRR